MIMILLDKELNICTLVSSGCQSSSSVQWSFILLNAHFYTTVLLYNSDVEQ